MKFSHSLKFNAVPEWQDSYLNYPTLKKTVYKLQQDQQINAGTTEQGYIVDVNQATVSELVDNFKSKKINERIATVEKSATSAGVADNKNMKNRLLGKHLFRLKKANNSDADLEITATDMEKNSSSETCTEKHSDKSASDVKVYTGDVTDSDTASLKITPSVVITDITGSANDDSFSDPKSLTFDPLKVFTKQLLTELNKINNFYQTKEEEIFLAYDNLVKDLETNNVDIDDVFRFTQAYNVDQNFLNTDSHHQYHLKSTLSRTVTNASVFDHINHMGNDYDTAVDIEKQGHHVEEMEDSDDDDEDDYEHTKEKDSVLLGHADFNVKQQMKITLKRKAVTLYINLSELKSFIELNRVGFTKICKKFDKTCNYSIKSDFIENFLPNNSRVFLNETIENLDYKLNQIVKIYAFLTSRLHVKTTKEDLENVKVDLRSHLRDHIVFERNTVWKDLLSIEKGSYNVDEDHTKKLGDEVTNSMMYMNIQEYKLPFNISIFGHDHVKLPAFLLTAQVVKILLAIIVFAVLVSVKTFNDPVQGRCLALLVACAMLWASEALPLYATSMLVPLLVVTCAVIKETGSNEPMAAPDAAAYILSTMWNSTIMILIGGFTLAAALSKYNVAKVLSSYILALAGTKPRNVLLAIMSVSLFLAMWISNVAAPILCYSLIQPVLRTLPTESPVAQVLVLGIALASNVAGMASPIASPQNVIALQYMNPNPGWGKWFAVALPVAIIAMLLIWVELILTFKINNVVLKKYKPIKEKFTVKQYFILVVTFVTILLWCVMTKIEGTFGQAGIITIIPIVLFFGTGLLKVDDLNNYPWSIVLLAMGGIALGNAVTSSGLLATIAMALQKRIMDYNVFVILLIFGILILVVATFVSHTVAALIIIPLVKEVGESLPTPHPLILIMASALIASGAMGLPTSGFPNVTAISMRDEVGKHYLTVNTFITRGVPASVIAYIVVITVGYGIMYSLKY
ncbi:PHO87 [[Candida] subhashii]|uniref:PHO87 n=1 Tax=[Candida] subhashii TaxID=561895 RepID=A0A8J5Q6B4_9ASCO|nr:PHO87 [[Candida] subhashii]KAG7661041.1 PHO87 [[Candida] subhashii]